MNTPAILIEQVLSPKIKILFLGYSQEQTSLIDDLIGKKCEVWHTDEKIQSTVGYDLVISYGYRYIIKKEVIESSKAPIVNLHISYLPWNRGAHPNFWSFYECTPSGVSIHLIDEGIDTGAIIYQRMINFNKDENTFSKTYKRLIIEIENLFTENLDEIISMNFTSIKQRRKGTYHRVADLPEEFSGWDSNIQSEVIRLDGILIKK
jgi:methionyl-tRNA formyltransferase